jgi:hypothetical protein
MMTYPDREKALSLLKCWRARKADIDLQAEAIEKIFGKALDEGTYGLTMWTIFEAYTMTLGELLGDELDWLTWYAEDNEMGKKARSAKPNKACKMKKIKTLEDLLDLIEEGRKR